MPRVYLMDNPQPNAFATGRNPAARGGRRDDRPAADAVARGGRRRASRHELAHIKNHDTLTMTITATIAGAISMLAQFGMFFGGGHRDNNSGLGVIGTIAMVILRADRRHAGADGDQPHARIRRRRSRRPHQRAIRRTRWHRR